jgi:hypothetical protein
MKKITLAALALTLAACGSASLDGSAPGSLSAATGTTPPPPPSACEEQVSDLIAGQHIDAGSVGITNDGDSLIITYTADAPWLITEVHAWAGTGSPPTNNKGTVVPGHFPYAASFNPGVSSYSIAIALADLDAECGEALNVVAHAVVKSSANGGGSQTAFGDGTPFTGPRWGFTMGYDVCCDDGVCENQSAEEWSTQQWTSVSPDQHFCWNETVGDGPSFGDIMASESTDAFTSLVKEWITAKLNGACTPWDGDVLGAMVAAHLLINDCEISEDEAAEAAELTAFLAAYNAL